MITKSYGDEWQNLSWKEKLQICQQGASEEDSLLHTYVAIYIALEAMFFALVLTLTFCISLFIIINILGILVSIWFMYLFYKRGLGVDMWGAILYQLFLDAKMTDHRDYYHSCFLRNELARKKCGWVIIIFGWRSKKWWHWFRSFKSARRAVITYTPLLVIFAWIVIMIIAFS